MPGEREREREHGRRVSSQNQNGDVRLIIRRAIRVLVVQGVIGAIEMDRGSGGLDSASSFNLKVLCRTWLSDTSHELLQTYLFIRFL